VVAERQLEITNVSGKEACQWYWDDKWKGRGRMRPQDSFNGSILGTPDHNSITEISKMEIFQEKYITVERVGREAEDSS
jgi:hypothetical protein